MFHCSICTLLIYQSNVSAEALALLLVQEEMCKVHFPICSHITVSMPLIPICKKNEIFSTDELQLT